MKTPYGLEIIESCLACPLHQDRLFCNLAPPALAGLDAISSAAVYPKGAVLFVEGQEPRGVFVICNGRKTLRSDSRGAGAYPGELHSPETISGVSPCTW